MEYKNINKEKNIVISEDKKFNFIELNNMLIDGLAKSNINIIKIIKINKSQLFANVEIDGTVYDLYFLIRNITGAGWKNKIDVKRIQVPNIEPYYKKNTYHIFIGIYNFDSNPIFVAWDAYRYNNHKTLRSCYINIDTLLIGYNTDYYKGEFASQLLWIFKNFNFKRFIIDYVLYCNKFHLNDVNGGNC